MIPSVLPTYTRADIAFERGEGCYLIDSQERRYLDFGSGIAVNALGHAHPHLLAALTEQAGKLWHTSNLYQIPAQKKLADRLVAASFADTVFFGNSGAEALECAFKMTRRFQHHAGRPERFRIITFEGAFHGRTLACIAAGGQAKYLEGFGPKTDGFDQVAVHDLEAVKRAITSETAGILIEPVQGEGGVRVVEPDFLRALRQLCDAHDLMLIFDEVQTGIGRTGTLFAYEQSGITPDIMAVAKGLGGGFPVGACLATERAASGMTAGSHASTFGGNPLAMAVGNAVLDVVLAPGFLDGVKQTSLRLKQQLAMLKDSCPSIIADVRGAGLLLGIKTHVPNGDLVNALRDEGMISVVAGDNVVRILPPLVAGEAELAEAMRCLGAACTKLAQQKDAA